MVQKLQKDNKGFTIIEVLIVLAIAALVMLIVFLAIPALQRNQRNTSRRNDVGRVGSVATEFVTNNNGRLPGTGGGVAADDADRIEAAAGQLSQYAEGYLSVDTAASRGEETVDDVNEMVLVTGAKCGADGQVVAGNARSMAIQYAVETSNADSPNPVCQEI